ncbi:MAG: PLP-dependent cysteine synthase family protein [Halobacteriaceae archaeon]
MNTGIVDTIGSPLVRLPAPDGSAIAAKLESFNPGGSAKDRPALAMIESAEAAGALDDGDRVVEATSGNTGIGLSMVCAARGYDLTVVMPESKSAERRQLMAAYGTDIELVDGDMADARDRADTLAEETDGVRLHQFEDPANPRAHYETTGPEILDALDGYTVDAFVAAVGTGGTITGVGRRLREAFPTVDIVAVEPASNAVLSGDAPGEDEFQGMGPGFVSPNLDQTLLTEVETVTLETAAAECRRLARTEGILVGQSSGAASVAATRVAERIADPSVDCPPLPGDRTFSTDGGAAADCPLVVTIFPDSGERYLSTGLFTD